MKVLITKCRNNSYWYRDSIGKTYEILRFLDEEFNKGVVVRADDGYTNVIFEGDFEYVNDVKMVEIISCVNDILWYKQHIGKKYEISQNQPSKLGFYVKTEDGLINWVYRKDVKVV